MNLISIVKVNSISLLDYLKGSSDVIRSFGWKSYLKGLFIRLSVHREVLSISCVRGSIDLVDLSNSSSLSYRIMYGYNEDVEYFEYGFGSLVG